MDGIQLPRRWLPPCLPLSLAFVALSLSDRSSAFLSGPMAPVNHLPTSSLVMRRLSIATMATSMDSTDYAKAELARKQAEYHAAQKQRMAEQLKAASSSGGGADGDPPVLADLALIPYLDAEGKISEAGASPKVKASLYCIYDKDQAAQYIGVSRNVAQSLRLHLARAPELTYGFRVFHITKPSRVLLEVTRDQWIQELGQRPPGNDEGAIQAMWESPLDVKPLMTPEDKTSIEDAKARQRPEEGAIKKIARRFEAEKVKILTERGFSESLRFDPKLKGKGLLDLYMEKPDDSAPNQAPPGGPSQAAKK